MFVHFKIGMTQAIPHSGNGFPGHLRKAVLDGIGNVFSGFAKNLKLPNYGAFRLFICAELLEVHACHKLPDVLTRFKHIVQKQAVSSCHIVISYS